MACPLPSRQMLDSNAQVFYSTVVKVQEDFMLWLQDVVPLILATPTKTGHVFLLPKTPAHKARQRGRPKKKDTIVDLNTLQPVSLRDTRYMTRCRKELHYVSDEDDRCSFERGDTVKSVLPKARNQSRTTKFKTENISDIETVSSESNKSRRKKRSKKSTKNSSSTPGRNDDNLGNTSPYAQKKYRLSNGRSNEKVTPENDEILNKTLTGVEILPQDETDACRTVTKESVKPRIVKYYEDTSKQPKVALRRISKVTSDVKRASTSRRASKRKSSLAKGRTAELLQQAKVSLVREAIASLSADSENSIVEEQEPDDERPLKDFISAKSFTCNVALKSDAVEQILSAATDLRKNQESAEIDEDRDLFSDSIYPPEQSHVNHEATLDEEKKRDHNGQDLFGNQKQTKVALVDSTTVADQSNTQYCMDFRPESAMSENMANLADMDEACKMETSNTAIPPPQSDASTALSPEIVTNTATTSSHTDVRLALSTLPPTLPKIPALMKVYGKNKANASVNLQSAQKSAGKVYKPTAQIVVSTPPKQDARTTRSKARQKIQEGETKKPEEKSQISSLKPANPLFAPIRVGASVSSSTSSSSRASQFSSSNNAKTPSSTLKTTKFFNNLASGNSGLKMKTPSNSGGSLFNAIFSMSSTKPGLNNLAPPSVTSFIKRNTPVKMTQKDIESLQLEKIKQQDTKQQEAVLKKDEFLKMRAEENRKKREEREQKAAAARKQLEEENRKKKEEKVLQREQEIKKMQQQKLAEHEARRKAEEEREKVRLKKEEQEKAAEKKAAAELKTATVAKIQTNVPNQSKGKSTETKNDSYEVITSKPSNKKSSTLKTKNDYGIDDLNSGDETDDPDTPKKLVPLWAQGSSLKAAMVHQYYANVNTLELFGLMGKPDLKKIFPGDRKRNRVRTSSAFWQDMSFVPFADQSPEGLH